MVNKHKYKEIVWVDIESPTRQDVESLIADFQIHPLVAEELMKPSERAKADLYGKYIYLILHFPKYKHAARDEYIREMDFIIGKNFIVTSHFEPLDLFMEVSKKLETRSILDKTENTENPGLIFYDVMKFLYKNVEHELDHIKRDLAIIENEIFAGNEDKMVHALSRINKTLIDFRYPLKLHDEILDSLDIREERLFETKNEHYTAMVIGEYKKIWGRMENNRDLLMDLRDTNDSLFSAKTNSIMKNLTIMSFLTFPLTLMTGIFSMNTTETPLTGLANGFWIILGTMAATTIFMITLFKYKRWI